ncbi:MAG: MFS transporter [Moraxellaceae bacterium]|nr:MFS transporter [Moraxellaceae bacterium]
MNNQFQLFTLQKFRSMFATQFLGAFNDNVFKQALLLVLAYTATAKMGIKISTLTNLASMLFILPYFLFSSLAGQVADKYEKSRLTQLIKMLEIMIMLLACVGFFLEFYWLLLFALFLLGTHSTFFGPIKYAYLPQVMHKDELVGANGLFQMGTSLSILLGMIIAGVLTQLDNSQFWISAMTISIAMIGYLTARSIPNTPAVQADLKINWNIFTTSWQTISYLYSKRFLFFIIMGCSWFWFYGATFLTQTAEFSKVILHGNQSVVILMLTLFSIGVSIGSLLCKSLSKNSISLKLLPFGMLGLTAFSVDLDFALSAFTQQNMGMEPVLLGISELMERQGVLRILFDLFALGFSGGLYVVPLYASMQAYSPKSHRARIVGANNIFNALFMVSSAVFAIVILTVLELGIPTLFLITAGFNVIFSIFLLTKLKKYEGSMSLQTLD